MILLARKSDSSLLPARLGLKCWLSNASVLRSVAPDAYPSDRVGDGLADVVHRTLFGLQSVNVHDIFIGETPFTHGPGNCTGALDAGTLHFNPALPTTGDVASDLEVDESVVGGERPGPPREREEHDARDGGDGPDGSARRAHG